MELPLGRSGIATAGSYASSSCNSTEREQFACNHILRGRKTTSKQVQRSLRKRASTLRELSAPCRSLFRGRPDIFPTRFVAKTTGRPGYRPSVLEQV